MSSSKCEIGKFLVMIFASFLIIENSMIFINILGSAIPPSFSQSIILYREGKNLENQKFRDDFPHPCGVASGLCGFSYRDKRLVIFRMGES